MTERRGSTPMLMPMNTCKALVSRWPQVKTCRPEGEHVRVSDMLVLRSCAPSGWQCRSPAPARAQRLS